MTDKKFRGKSENEVWLPLIQTMLDGSNLAMTLSEGNDIKYVYFYALLHDMLVPIYVDSEIIDLKDFNRLFHVFVYILETVYGDPYSKECKSSKKVVDIRDYFNQIKKHWNDNISEEIKKYN